MALSKLRAGRITSSEIHKIAKNWKGDKFLKPAITYIDQVKRERKLKRSLDGGADSQAIRWGNYMEMRLFKNIGLEWSMASQETLLHPKEKFSDYWAGTPDLKSEAEKKCGEIKCYQLNHFCKIVDIFNSDLSQKEKIEKLKADEPEIYWQVVSNCMILGYKIATMIIYAPTETEMVEIRKELGEAQNQTEEMYKYSFIQYSQNSELAVLPDDSEYDSINEFEFEVPMNDKIHLTKAMTEAIKLIDA